MYLCEFPDETSLSDSRIPHQYHFEEILVVLHEDRECTERSILLLPLTTGEQMSQLMRGTRHFATRDERETRETHRESEKTGSHNEGGERTEEYALSQKATHVQERKAHSLEDIERHRN